MASRKPDRQRGGGGELGIFDLHRIDLHHLAAVRYRQPVAGDDRAGGGDNLPGQYGQSEIRVADGDSDVLCRSDYLDRGSAFDQEHLPATGAEAGQDVSGLSGFDADGDLCHRRGAGSDRGRQALLEDATWREGSGRGFRRGGGWRDGKYDLLLDMGRAAVQSASAR